jgi:hypothetical protein
MLLQKLSVALPVEAIRETVYKFSLPEDQITALKVIKINKSF